MATLYLEVLILKLCIISRCKIFISRFLLVFLLALKGAHQSIITPLIGIGQPNLLMFEPTFADELEVLFRYALNFMQEDNGSSVYIRLTTRNLKQPERKLIRI